MYLTAITVSPIHVYNEKTTPMLSIAFRLSMICGELIGEVDEYDIYKYVMKEGEKSLHQFLCMNDEEEALNACSKEVPKDEL